MCWTVPSLGDLREELSEGVHDVVHRRVRSVRDDRVPGAAVHDHDLDLGRARLLRRVLIRDRGQRGGGRGADDVVVVRADRAGRPREVPRRACAGCRSRESTNRRSRAPRSRSPARGGMVRHPASPLPRWIDLAVARASRGERQQESGDAPDGSRSRHAADATIRAMTSGGALLVALFLQSASGAPGAAPEARVDEGPPRSARRRRLHLARRSRGARRGPFAAHPVRRRRRRSTPSVVVTSARPGNVVAELVLATPGTEQPPRRFVARSCAEAADAIALIIAVTLDPTLKRNAADTSGASSTAEGGADRAPPPAEKPADRSTAAAASPAASAARHRRSRRRRPRRLPARRQFGASVAGQTIFGPAPAVMPGIAIYGMAALERDGVWSPALFLGATHVWRDDLSEPGGTASFTLDAASLDACPLRLGAGRGSSPARALRARRAAERERHRHRAGGRARRGRSRPRASR